MELIPEGNDQDYMINVADLEEEIWKFENVQVTISVPRDTMFTHWPYKRAVGLKPVSRKTVVSEQTLINLKRKLRQRFVKFFDDQKHLHGTHPWMKSYDNLDVAAFLIDRHVEIQD